MFITFWGKVIFNFWSTFQTLFHPMKRFPEYVLSVRKLECTYPRVLLYFLVYSACILLTLDRYICIYISACLLIQVPLHSPRSKSECEWICLFVENDSTIHATDCSDTSIYSSCKRTVTNGKMGINIHQLRLI